MLEEKIDALVAALTRNSDILERGLTRAASTVAAATKPAATKPAATKPAAAKKPAGPSLEDVRSAFSTYLAVKGAEKEEHKENVRAILNHFGASLASEIAEESRGEALGYLAQFTAGETPDFMNEAGEEESLV